MSLNRREFILSSVAAAAGLLLPGIVVSSLPESIPLDDPAIDQELLTTWLNKRFVTELERELQFHKFVGSPTLDGRLVARWRIP